VEVFDPASTQSSLILQNYILLRHYIADWIQNTYFETTAAGLFVTGETTVKVFIPVVTVYYLRDDA
jgi:hypothetical protein